MPRCLHIILIIFLTKDALCQFLENENIFRSLKLPTLFKMRFGLPAVVAEWVNEPIQIQLELLRRSQV